MKSSQVLPPPLWWRVPTWSAPVKLQTLSLDDWICVPFTETVSCVPVRVASMKTWVPNGATFLAPRDCSSGLLAAT